jgi:hypothetical protein
MSLLSICMDVADDLGIDRPKTPIINSNDQAARRFKQAARRAAISLQRAANWDPLVIEYTFTANGQSDFDLPADYSRMVDDTLWERSRYWQLRGAMSPQKWQRYKSSIYGRATLWRRWRMRVPSGATVGATRKFSIDPPISASDTTSSFVFEYVSAWWCRVAATGQLTGDWTADADTSIIGEQLLELGVRWRMLRRLGLAYDEEKDEYEHELSMQIARDSGGGAILDLVPSYKRDDFIGQYTLGAFPPTSNPPPPVVRTAVPVSGNPLRPAPQIAFAEDGDPPLPPPAPAPPRVVSPGRPLRPRPPDVMPSEY